MTLETEKLVDQFLKEIKKNLPDWIKNNEEKLEDILLEISSHLWDSAQEIAGTDAPDPASMQEAITQYGNPKEIAKSYKTRGTPKVFITEELWAIYTKVVWFFIPIIFVVITIVQLFIIEPNNLLQALINGVIISYPIILTFIMLITGIFVALSYEGYFPADLGSQATAQDETKLDYYKADEFLVGGLLGILFGFFIIILPNYMVNLFRIIINLIIGLFGYSWMPITFDYVSVSIALQIWIALMGITAVITGVTNLLKIRSKEIGFQFNMNMILIFTGIADFVLSIYIVANLHLFSELLPLPVNILIFLGVVGVILTFIGLIVTISRNAKLYALREEEKNSSPS